MKRIPSYRKSIVKVDALLAKYASSAALLDALHAMAIMDDDKSPTLTELVLSHLRSARGHARIRPPLALGELFDLRVARYAPSQTRSISALQCARRFLCSRLGEDRAVETITEDEVAKALARFSDPQSFNSVFRRLRLAFNWAVQAGLVDGVRTAEIARARWEDIDLDGALLRVPRPKGFTSGHKPRLIELEPCAVAWMRRWRDWLVAAGGRASGPVVLNPRRFALWKARRLAPAGDSWGNNAAHNVMRHTYATMHVAAFRDAAATALNLGHAGGTELLERHYRGVVPKSVADAYWRILPSAAPLPPPEPLPGRGFRSDLKRPL